VTTQPPRESGTTRFLLVRHGESTWNAVGRWQGRSDPPLSDAGEDQARRASSSSTLHGPFDSVATSTLRRARQTGELIAAHASLELLDPYEDLIERSAGEWEGLMRVEIEERYPNWLAQQRRPPGYEPDDEIIVRATRALRAIDEQCAGSTVLVVSHGGVINALERHAGEPWRQLTNLEARWFEFGGTNGDVVERVVPVGDRVHLLAADAPLVESDSRYA
jgi:broad specificity phosphatase PhoE